MNITLEEQIKWAKENLAMLETSTAKQVREVRIKQSVATQQLEKQKAVIRTLQGIADKKASQVVMFKDDNKMPEWYAKEPVNLKDARG